MIRYNNHLRVLYIIWVHLRISFHDHVTIIRFAQETEMSQECQFFPSAWKAQRSGQNILWNRLLILHQKLNMKWKCTNVDRNKSWHCDLNTEELWSGDRKSTSWERGGRAIKHVRAAWTLNSPLKRIWSAWIRQTRGGRGGAGISALLYILVLVWVRVHYAL